MAVRTLGDEPTPMINLKLPAVVAQAVKEAAEANYESQQTFIRRIIVEALRAQGRLP